MKRRLFLAIALPASLTDALEREIEKIRYGFTDEIRFSDRAQWHITLSFLGNQSDDAMAGILGAMKVASTYPAPDIAFDAIAYGPRDKEPRMIWLNGDLKTDKTLHDLKQTLQDRLADGGVQLQRREFKRFQTHVTLAKIKTHESLPELSIPFHRTFAAASLDLMESHQSRAGTTYELLQKIPFQVL